MEIKKEFNINKKNFSEWYNTILYQADLVDIRYNVRGFIVHKPWATVALRLIYELFESEFEKDGQLPVIFPTVIPEENFEKEKEHAAGFLPEVFWVTREGEKQMDRPVALRPTSETAFYQMYSLWLQTHADLPMKYYQSRCSVYRAEKETNPFLRGREFLFMESHDVFRTETEAHQQIQMDMNMMETVLTKKLGIPVLLFKRPKGDTFAGAEETYAYDVLMPDGKALQVGSTHFLGQKFAVAFGLNYKDEDAKDCVPYQTCFGPGIWRIMASVIIAHGDGKGLIFPVCVAPVQVVIIPISKDKNEALMHKCRELEANLKNKGYRVTIDDSNRTPGYKFNFWEMKGVPLRVEMGERELKEDSVTVVRRDNRERRKVLVKNVATVLQEMESDMLKNLRNKAEEELKAHINKAESKEEVKRILDEIGGYVKAPFCSIDADGTPCADELKAYTTGGRVRGVNAKEREGASGSCIVCGKPAKHLVYIARQY